MPVLISHYGLLPWREMFLHARVCLFNPMKEGKREEEDKNKEKLHEEGRREEGGMFNAIKGGCLERGSKLDKEKKERDERK